MRKRPLGLSCPPAAPEVPLWASTEELASLWDEDPSEGGGRGPDRESGERAGLGEGEQEGESAAGGGALQALSLSIYQMKV